MEDLFINIKLITLAALISRTKTKMNQMKINFLHLWRGALPVSLFALGLIGLAPSKASAQTTIFSESFGIPANSITSIATYETTDGFDRDELTYAGTADVRRSYTSDGLYSGASGNGNIFFNYGKSLTATGISTVGQSNVSLSFGLFTSKATDNNFKVSYSTNNGSTYTDMPLTYTSLTSSNWQTAMVRANGFLPGNSVIVLKFENLSTSVQFRIDDITIKTGECGGVASPTILFKGLSTDGVFCLNNNFTLSASIPAGFSYQWKKNVNSAYVNRSEAGNSGTNSGATASTASISIAGTLANEGEYYLEITKAGACTLSDVISLTSAVGPNISVPASSCVGSSIVALDNSASTTGTTYKWTRVNGAFQNNDAALTLPAANVGVADTYTITATDANCATAQSTIVYALPATPAVDTKTSSFTSYKCGAELKNFSVTNLSAYTSPTYQWYENAAATTVATTGTGIMSATYQPAVAGTYTVRVTQNGCTSAISPVITYTAVNKPSGAIDVQEGGTTAVTICPGDVIDLSLATNLGNASDGNTGTDQVTFDFYKGSVTAANLRATITGDENDGVYTFSPIGTATDDGGTYNVIITNTVTGCVSTPISATVVVGDPLTGVTIVSEGGTATGSTIKYCESLDGQSLLSYKDGFLIEDQVDDFTIEWFKKNGSSYDSRGNSLDLADNSGGINGAGIYRLSAVQNNSCPALIDVTVELNALPTATFTYSDADQSVCFGEPATITASMSANTTYTWTDSNSTSLAKGTAASNVLSLKYGTGAILNAVSRAAYVLSLKNTITGCENTLTPVTHAIKVSPLVPVLSVQANKFGTFNSVGGTVNYYWANNTNSSNMGAKTDLLNLNTNNTLVSANGSGTTNGSTIAYYFNGSTTPVSGVSSTASATGTFSVNLNAFNSLFSTSSATAVRTYTIQAKATKNGCSSDFSTAKNIVAFNISPSTANGSNIAVCAKVGTLNVNQDQSYSNVSTAGPSANLTLGKCAASSTTLRPAASEEEVAEVAAETAVAQGVSAYPNPFKDQLNIQFFVAQENSSVNVMITDMLGRIVMVYAPQSYAAGVHTLTWDGLAANGSKLTEGMYNVKVVVGNEVNTTRVLLNN